MTCAELSQLIVRRIITRAQQEPDPVAYFSRAAARVMALEHAPINEMESELIKFGHEFGLLAPEVMKCQS
jgi:hypothetical protein